MALLKWAYEDDDRKEDESPFQSKTVQSVQNSWQPSQGQSNAAGGVGTNIFGGQSQSNNNQVGSYLFSQEKAQADAQKRQQEEAEELARRQAAAAAAAQAAARAQAARQAQVSAQAQSQADAPAAIIYRPQSKLLDKDNVAQRFRFQQTPQEKNEGLWGFVKSIGKGIGSGFQQGLAGVADAISKGGRVVSMKLTGKDDTNLAGFQDWLYKQRDLNGNTIQGTRWADEAAGNIAAGRGNLRDWGTVGAAGLQTGLDATQFIPTSAAKNAAQMGLKQLGKQALKEGATMGALQGLATGEREYGQSGDILKALKEGGLDALVNAGVQSGIDFGTGALGRGMRRMRGAKDVPQIKDIPQLTEDFDTPTGAKTSSLDGNVSSTPDIDTNAPARSIQFEEAPRRVTPDVEAAPTRVNRETNVVGNIPQRQADESISNRLITPDETPARILRDNDENISITRPDETPAQIIGKDAPEAKLNNVLDERAQKRAGGAQKEPLAQNKTAQPVAEGVPIVNTERVLPADKNAPTIKADEARALQEARIGGTQADEAVANARLQQLDAEKPRLENESQPSVPKDVLENEASENAASSYKEQMDRLINGLDEANDFKARVANAAGAKYDPSVEFSEYLDLLRENPRVPEKLIRQLEDTHAKLEKGAGQFNEIQAGNRAQFSDDVNDFAQNLADADVSSSRRRSALQRDVLGVEQGNMNALINKLEGKLNKRQMAENVYDNLNSYSKANMLLSAPSLERNWSQDTMGTLRTILQNPIRATKGIVDAGVIRTYINSIKRFGAGFKVTPKTVSEVPGYLMGRALDGAYTFSGTQTMVDLRKHQNRIALAESFLKQATGAKKVSTKEASKFARMLGNDLEVLDNMAAGVTNGMANSRDYKRAVKAYEEWVKTASPEARDRFIAASNRQMTLSNQISKTIQDQIPVLGTVLSKAIDFVNPYIRTVTNLAITAADNTLNPMGKSVIDISLSGSRSKLRNALASAQHAAVTYGGLVGVAALVANGVIGYNDGDQIDRPRGVYIKTGENTYIPVRATDDELPIALVTAAIKASQDADSGKTREPGYYAKIITDSLPYIDATEQASGAVSSANALLNGDNNGDNGYAAKNFGINAVKRYVPFSNNGVLPAVKGLQGESLNAKSTYDKDFGTWMKNAIKKNYLDENAYNQLKDSRDAAGRVRTVDNQGIFVHKQINDANTAEFNKTVDDLTTFGRELGLGKDVKTLFRANNDDKNNNFRSVQSAITFLDTNGKADDSTKLVKNQKLADLARQMRDGFFGDSGSELLTLDGKELKSDASVPNKQGTKNSQLPISMQSIKNAIAQTDLPADAREALYGLTNSKTELYNRLKAKQIDYSTYQAGKQQIANQEASILANSPSYQRLNALMTKLDETGFFNPDGFGSTKSGQTYLWNALNSLLAAKGSTPAAQYAEGLSSGGYGRYSGYGRRGFGFGSRGSGFGDTYKPKLGDTGIQWRVGARSMPTVKMGKMTPFRVQVQLENAVDKNKTQPYRDRSF